jgi:glucose-1-phosphate adenylyltransferase
MHLTHVLQKTLVLVLAGGQGRRLEPLTLRRAKPAVPFGGSYRIVDFTLSNCIHSGLRRVYVLTQYQAHSLEEHLRFAWNFLPRRLMQFISALAPHHLEEGRWYSGTADAIHHNLETIREEDAERILILSGDHVYRMDYGAMIRRHVESGAVLTVGAVRIPAAESPRFGVFEADRAGRAVAFDEKPARGKEIPGEPGWCLGSMGIYVFETDELFRRLETDAALGDASGHDFGKDIIPRMVKEAHVQTYEMPAPAPGQAPYWRDVGTIDAYYEANLDLCSLTPQLNLYDQDWPIYTLWHNDPPAKTVLNARVSDALLCPGVVVSGAEVRRSILSNRVYVHPEAVVEDSIVFSGTVIGKGARIKRAILDKWLDVPPGETIGHDPLRDRERYTVSDTGVVVVPRPGDMVRDWDVATPRPARDAY